MSHDFRCRRRVRPRKLLGFVLAAAAACSNSPEPPKPIGACDGPGGGLVVTLTPHEPLGETSLRAAAATFRTRATSAFGSAEACLAGGAVEVRLLAVAARDRIERVLGSSGVVEMRPVLEDLAKRSSEWAMTPSCSDPSRVAAASQGTILCARSDDENLKTKPSEDWDKVRLGPAAFAGEIASASAVHDPSTGIWSINLILTPEGAAEFRAITGRLACNPAGAPTRRLALVLDGVVVFHPQIAEDVACNQGISGGRVQMTLGLSEQEAKDIAAALDAGALPARFAVRIETRG